MHSRSRRAVSKAPPERSPAPNREALLVALAERGRGEKPGRKSAYGESETRRKAIERGAAGLFTQPIDFPELRGEIWRRLHQGTGAS